MYSLPQEIELWYIIPAIRRELAKILIERYNLKQNQIARILGTSEAAISQYLNKKRGQEIKFPKNMQENFEQAAQAIIKNNQKALYQILNLINLVREQGLACYACKKYNKGVVPLCACKPKLEIKI